MSPTVNSISAGAGTPDSSTTVGTMSDANAAPFAQLLDQFALRAQQVANTANAETTSDAAPMTPSVESGDTPRELETTEAPTTTPDAAMIAALLSQMQTPYLRSAATTPAVAQEPGSPAQAAQPGTANAAAVTTSTPLDAPTAQAGRSPDATLATAADGDALVSTAIQMAAHPEAAATAQTPHATALPLAEEANAATRPLDTTAGTAPLPPLRNPLAAAEHSGDTPRHGQQDGRDTMAQRTSAAVDTAALGTADSAEQAITEAMQHAVFTAAPAPGNARGRTPQREQTVDPIGLAAAPTLAGNVATPADSGMPSVNLTPRLDTPEWKPAFASGVRTLVQDGVNSASLQLNPAELGPIDVRIVLTEQRADISFLVKNGDANSAIQAALPDLRDQLARSGIQLGQTSVGGQRQEARAFGDEPRRNPAPRTDAIGAATTAPPRPRATGQIDTFA